MVTGEFVQLQARHQSPLRVRPLSLSDRSQIIELVFVFLWSPRFESRYSNHTNFDQNNFLTVIKMSETFHLTQSSGLPREPLSRQSAYQKSFYVTLLNCLGQREVRREGEITSS